ncbi:hypothetical protein [Muricoccus nepalensis]|uniref:hypothetical protein n=1 Tax=Muricoccus nepalensis TaxID=1854500 RepID=UPI00112A52FD|nr:hypothetical protein [Roseomonas nepalensis]
MDDSSAQAPSLPASSLLDAPPDHGNAHENQVAKAANNSPNEVPSQQAPSLFDTPSASDHGKAHENKVAKTADNSPAQEAPQPASPLLDTPSTSDHGKAHENQVAKAADNTPAQEHAQPPAPLLTTPSNLDHGKAHENQVAKAVDNSPTPASPEQAPPLLDMPSNPDHRKAHDNQPVNKTDALALVVSDDVAMTSPGTSWPSEGRGDRSENGRSDIAINLTADLVAQDSVGDGPKQPHVNQRQEPLVPYLSNDFKIPAASDGALASTDSHGHEASNLSHAPAHDWHL